MTDLPDVTVIIPTLAEPRRAAGLMHAIDSVLEQDGVRARPLILINGDRFDPALRAALERRPDIDVHYQNVGGLSPAIQSGRRLVRSTFFSYLDDDDWYLPGSLIRRIGPMLADRALAVVVSNGWNRSPDGRTAHRFPGMARFQNDPLTHLVEENWLASCGGVFRTSRVDQDIFHDLPMYYEWTMVAFRLALSGLRILFLEDKTFVVHETTDSLSRGEQYVQMAPAAIRQMIVLDPPGPVARALARKYSDSHHWLSERYRVRGELKAAWRHHLRSLGSLHGLARYLLYTRHLLIPRGGA